jgi:hypothetical protein
MSGSLQVGLTVTGGIVLRLAAQDDDQVAAIGTVLEPADARDLARTLLDAADTSDRITGLIAAVDELEPHGDPLADQAP